MTMTAVASAAFGAELTAPLLLLWPNGAPGALGDSDEDKPALWLYPAAEDKSTGSAVVICPGGGYRHLAIDHEGEQIARWCNDHGISAYVLRYRLGPNYHHPTQIGDAQRALRIVRAHAKEWKLDPQRVGIMGFSAGGHLASTAATLFDDGHPDADDEVDHIGCRPDFAVLAYPVIMLDGEFAHRGSRENLLGKKPDPKLVESLSNENAVTPQTPPTFLFHTGDDKTVIVNNSVQFYLALRRAKVPAEMHIFESGRHGIGLARDNPAVAVWPELLASWLSQHGIIQKPQQSDGDK